MTPARTPIAPAAPPKPSRLPLVPETYAAWDRIVRAWLAQQGAKES